MGNLEGKVYTTEPVICEDLLFSEQPGPGVQSLAFEYKQHLTTPLSLLLPARSKSATLEDMRFAPSCVTSVSGLRSCRQEACCEFKAG